MSEGTHFEILAMGRGSWQVQAVLDREDSAIQQAHDMHRLDKGGVLKVVKVEFHSRSGEFREREICKVGKVKAGEGRYSEGLDAGPACTELSELLSLTGRRAIKRVLRSWLDSIGVTPFELLHHPDYLNRLENSGTMLQSAVQRAAMAQSNATGGSLHDRQRELFRLVDEAIAKARKLWRDDSRPRFDGIDLPAFIESLGDSDDISYFFNASIADWLSSFKTPGEKLQSLVTLAEQAKGSAERARIDDCLTDFLEDAQAVTQMLGDRASLGDALMHIASLVGGEPDGDDDGDEEFAVLKQLIRGGELPKCRQTLLRRIVSSLEGQRSLSDHGVVADARIAAELRRCLCSEDGQVVGGSEMEAAFERRSEKFVSPDAIGRVLDGIVAPDKRVKILLDVEEGVMGRVNKRRFGEYVVAVLRVPDNIEQLSAPQGPAAVYMRELAGIQKRILQSGLTEKQKEEGAEILDRICVTIMKSERILEKVGERSPGPVATAVALLRLCAAGTSTEGAASDTVRERIVSVLKTPTFLNGYLSGAEGNNERRQRLYELQELFEKAQVPETPLTAAVAMALR